MAESGTGAAAMAGGGNGGAGGAICSPASAAASPSKSGGGSVCPSSDADSKSLKSEPTEDSEGCGVPEVSEESAGSDTLEKMEGVFGFYWSVLITCPLSIDAMILCKIFVV